MEKTLEAYFRNSIKKAGGLALKFSSPGFTGVPDRVTLMPNGELHFVEFKNGSKGKLSPRQIIVFQQMEALGFPVHVISTKEQIKEFLDTYCAGSE